MKIQDKPDLYPVYPNCEAELVVECGECGAMLTDLDSIQKKLEEWRNYNFGYSRESWMQNFMGIVEEVGELVHARLKQLQGIRGSEEGLRAKEIDAVGDIMIFLLNYCNTRGISLRETLHTTLKEVLKRDWKADPLTGGKSVGESEQQR